MDDGLQQPWSGRVFLNPSAYSKIAGKREFICQARGFVMTRGSVTAATVVLSYDFSASCVHSARWDVYRYLFRFWARKILQGGTWRRPPPRFMALLLCI